MSERSPSPSGAGPFRLSLEQQKKRAKELLAGVRAGDADALTRWTRHRPDGAAPCLATAQHVIARELGLPSWPRLKAHVEAMDRARRAMGQGDALDGDCRTLHIRCGSDIRERLRDAGLTGDFLEYSNPFCQGPVTDGPDFLDRRAAFLAASYGTALGVSAADLRARLEREEAGLAAANTYDRVVLWFEHDGYDQLILARCLERFAVLGPPPELEMVSLNHFPGGARFIGLGQLPPEALRLLWAKRRAVSWADCRAGREVWHALTAPEPDGLAALLRQGFGGQRPIMAAAVRRHLQELPGTADGLGLTQRLVLTALAERECTAGGVWRELMRETDPLPFLTDLMLWDIVGGLLGAADPAVIADAAGATPWPARRLALTGTGRDVLAGRRDWLSCGPAERWVGGVPIRPGAPVWRWDDAADAVRCY